MSEPERTPAVGMSDGTGDAARGAATREHEALERAARALAAAAGFDVDTLPRLRLTGRPFLGGAYPVGAFATAAIATTAAALAELTDHRGPITVDASLAGGWFRAAVRPREAQPSPWAELTGDYRAADGWIRLHMNAPHHRDAALAVLGLQPAHSADTPAAEPTRDDVAAAVAPFDVDVLEAAVVEAGGAAARARSVDDWREHPQGIAVESEPLIAVDETGPARPEQPFPPGRPERPLEGVRVLDLTRVLAGPVATRALAMLGADVLRIDPPEWDEPAVEPDMTLGKRCARVDAHSVDGGSELLALVAEADVLVHGYRPGALDSLGLDAETLAAVRSGLVEVQLDAWGYSGPWAERRGFDSLVQLATGIAGPHDADATDAADARAASDAPIALPVQALDHATGWLAATAALRAVAHARRTGEGSRSRVSLARTALELERLRELLGPAEARPEPRLTTTRIDTPWGLADLLASPLQVGGVRLHTPHPPRHLGSDAPYWLVDDRHDEEEAERTRPTGPRAVVMSARRAVVWAALSGLIVWATQGLLEVVGAAVLGRPDIGAGWWSNPAWAVGAATQAVVLAVTWMLASRRLAIGPALAVTTVLGAVAHLIAATLVVAGVSTAPMTLRTGMELGVVVWFTGAAFVQLGAPVVLALSRPFLGRASGRSRAVDPQYARRGRRRR